MLRKFLLIGVFTLCAALYAYGPEWSSVSAQTPNQSIPDVAGIGDATPLEGEGTVGDAPQGNFVPGEPLTLNVDYTNETDNPLEAPAFSVALPEGIVPADDSEWEAAGDGPDGTTIYTFSPETNPVVAPGATVSAPLLVDIADTVGSDLLTIPTRFDAYDGSQEPGERLSAQIGQLEVLPVIELPESIASLGSLSDTTIPTTTEEIQFTLPTESSPAPTLDDSTGEVSIPIEFTNTSADTLDNTLLVVEIPEGTDLPPNSGWREEIIKDADGNEQRVAVLNVGQLEPGQAVNVPFPLLGNNLQLGETLTVPTLLTANDGDVQLSSSVSATLEAIQVPTSLTEINEPGNTSLLYLPIILH